MRTSGTAIAAALLKEAAPSTIGDIRLGQVQHQSSKRQKSALPTSLQFTADYERLERSYGVSGKPIEVNFRKLVPLYSGVDRATHLVHSYPAKLLLNIPLFFLNCSQLHTKDGNLLDPFCGTGTVLVEALLAGWRAVGADVNPLARLIAQVKVTSINEAMVLNAYETICARYRTADPIAFSPVMDVDRWFSPSVKKSLGRLLRTIREISDDDTRRFLEVCFSSCVRRVSFADPRLSVPVRLKSTHSEGSHSKPVHVKKLFEDTVRVNMVRLRRLATVDPSLLKYVCILDDARKLGTPPSVDAHTDLIITSPPYAGAQKYIRSSSLSLGWLGLAPEDRLRNLERLTIGREHFSKSEYSSLHDPGVPSARRALHRIWAINPLRAHIAATYLLEMKDALTKACARLRKGGHLVLVIGNNSVCGAPFRNNVYLREILETLGLTLRLELIDDIRSRGLMTKRNTTAAVISREHICVFLK